MLQGDVLALLPLQHSLYRYLRPRRFRKMVVVVFRRTSALKCGHGSPVKEGQGLDDGLGRCSPCYLDGEGVRT